MTRISWSEDPWRVLGIEPTDDPRAVKRAYARRLKRIDQQEEAAAFEELRAAYESAREIAEWRQRERPKEEPVEEQVAPDDDDVVPEIPAGEFHPADVTTGTSTDRELTAPFGPADGTKDPSRDTDDVSVVSLSSSIEQPPSKVRHDHEEEPALRPIALEEAAFAVLEDRSHAVSPESPTTTAPSRFEDALDEVMAELKGAGEERDPEDADRRAAQRLFDWLQPEAELSLIDRERLEIDLGHLLLSQSEMPRQLFLTAATHWGWHEGDLCRRLFGVAGVQLQQRALAWQQRSEWQRTVRRGDVGAAILLGDYVPKRYRWLAWRPRFLRSMQRSLQELRTFPELEQYEIDPRIVTWWRERLLRRPPPGSRMLLISALLFLVFATALTSRLTDSDPGWLVAIALAVAAVAAIATSTLIQRAVVRWGPILDGHVADLAVRPWFRRDFATVAAALLPLHVLTAPHPALSAVAVSLLLIWVGSLHLRGLALFLGRLLGCIVAGAVTVVPIVGEQLGSPTVVFLLGLLYLADWDEPLQLRRLFLLASALPTAVLLRSLVTGALDWGPAQGLVLASGIVLLGLSLHPRSPALSVAFCGALTVLFDLLGMLDSAMPNWSPTVRWTTALYVLLIVRGLIKKALEVGRSTSGQ